MQMENSMMISGLMLDSSLWVNSIRAKLFIMKSLGISPVLARIFRRDMIMVVL